MQAAAPRPSAWRRDVTGLAGGIIPLRVLGFWPDVRAFRLIRLSCISRIRQYPHLNESPYLAYHRLMERKSTRFEVRLSPELGDEIDDWRRKQQDIPSRAEAARRLIEQSLKAATGQQPAKKPAK